MDRKTIKGIAAVALVAIVVLVATGVIRDWMPFAVGAAVALIAVAWDKVRHAQG